MAHLNAKERFWLAGLYLMYSPAFFACGLMVLMLPSIIIGRKPMQSPAGWFFLGGLLVSIPLSFVGVLMRAHASRAITRLANHLSSADVMISEGSRLGAWAVLSADPHVLVLERRAMPIVAASIFRSAAILMWLLLTSQMISQAWIGLPGKSIMASILIAVWFTAISTAALWYVLSLLAIRRFTLDTSSLPGRATLRKQLLWPLPGASTEYVFDAPLVVLEFDGLRIQDRNERWLRLEIGRHRATAESKAAALGSDVAHRLGLELIAPRDE